MKKLAQSTQQEVRVKDVLALLTLALLSLGLIMVCSASLEISQHLTRDPFYFFKRQLVYLLISLVVAGCVIRIPMALWNKVGGLALIAGFALLVLVLIPGIGHKMNGSMRWINLGFVTFQPSELVKFFVLLYISGYLVRKNSEVRQSWLAFARPLLLMLMLVVLLLLEPDFGSIIVMMSAVVGMLFLAGVRLPQFLLLILIGLIAVSLVAVTQSYRIARLITFTNPWSDQFGAGYQLTQSLIALGRGDWLGSGLGGSLQKLFYLPEAHTDFLFSIMVEELGLLGGAMVVLAFIALVLLGLRIARQAEQQGQFFSAYVAYGISILLGMQSFINIGVCTGVLPTKGLTLPLMSYGGSSLVISVAMIAVVYRVALESSTVQGVTRRA